jgi:hypothetical protein
MGFGERGSIQKNSKLIEQAKRRLALDMCPGLGDLIELSDGQFLAKFLHPEIQKSALSDLRQRRRRSAVRNAFQELITHVQTVSGLPSSLSPGDLMTAAFEPKKGKLSNGKISNQQASNFEFGKQLNMQQLFQGSLYIRNLYVHDIPAPKFSEAVQLLMLASYLFGVVDEQRAKGITLTHD